MWQKMLQIGIGSATDITPDGETVTPVNDVQIWLKCAGITDKDYGTLNEVLNDKVTLINLCSNENALKYMIRSEEFISVCNNVTAMSILGADNSLALPLLNNSNWCTSICNSTHFEKILDVKNPYMTSDTAPSGTVSCSGTYDGSPYLSFDSSDSTYYTPTSGQAIGSYYLQYDFGREIIGVKFLLNCVTYGTCNYVCKIQASNSSDSNFVDVSNNFNYGTSYKSASSINTKNINSYRYYRLVIVSGDTHVHYYGSYALRPTDFRIYGREK